MALIGRLSATDRHDLESALDRDGSPWALAARAALRAGASFPLPGRQHHGAPAHELRDIWSFRHQVMLDTGVTPRPGLGEAVSRLTAEGASPIHIATITSHPRRFILFLSEDLARCVACM